MEAVSERALPSPHQFEGVPAPEPLLSPLGVLGSQGLINRIFGDPTSKFCLNPFNP